VRAAVAAATTKALADGERRMRAALRAFPTVLPSSKT